MMKYWFFAVLLANVVFLLWEFHYGAFDHELPSAALENEEKQILTVSEAAGNLTPSDASISTAPAENLAGLQAQHEALTANPQVTPRVGSETVFPTTVPMLPEKDQQPTVHAEIAEVAPNVAVTKGETVTSAESVASPAANAGKEPTAALALSQIPETSDAAVQVPGASLEQRPANAPTETVASPSISTGKGETAVTASSTTPEVSNIPPQAQVAQSEQAETKHDGEVTAPAESATPQEQPPVAENSAPTPAIPEQTQIAVQPQTAPTTAVVQNSADSATQPPPAVSEPPKPEVLKTACYTAGPVENAAAFEALLNRHRSQLKELKFSATEKRKNNTYLVYHPAAATTEQSIATAEMLRSNYGISDLLVFREGELKGMISLGVFSNEQRAKAAQNQFEAKGVHAEIRPRYPLEVHYTVQMRWNEQQAEAAQQLSNVLKKRFPGVRQMVRGCK